MGELWFPYAGQERSWHFTELVWCGGEGRPGIGRSLRKLLVMGVSDELGFVLGWLDGSESIHLPFSKNKNSNILMTLFHSQLRFWSISLTCGCIVMYLRITKPVRRVWLVLCCICIWTLCSRSRSIQFNLLTEIVLSLISGDVSLNYIQ